MGSRRAEKAVQVGRPTPRGQRSQQRARPGDAFASKAPVTRPEGIRQPASEPTVTSSPSSPMIARLRRSGERLEAANQAASPRLSRRSPAMSTEGRLKQQDEARLTRYWRTRSRRGSFSLNYPARTSWVERRAHRGAPGDRNGSGLVDYGAIWLMTSDSGPRAGHRFEAERVECSLSPRRGSGFGDGFFHHPGFVLS
jgi:hypothetical protein